MTVSMYMMRYYIYYYIFSLYCPINYCSKANFRVQEIFETRKNFLHMNCLLLRKESVDLDVAL